MNYTLEGRANVEVETDEFVEILTDKPPHYNKDCQTEFHVEPKKLRWYMEEKKGVDVDTQIQDGEIFNFDYEVGPMLNVTFLFRFYVEELFKLVS